jgi:hypothetical protein
MNEKAGPRVFRGLPLRNSFLPSLVIILIPYIGRKSAKCLHFFEKRIKKNSSFFSEAGKTYILYFTAYGEPVGNDKFGKTWGVNIYVEPKEGLWDVKNHEFIAFTRFYKYEDK